MRIFIFLMLIAGPVLGQNNGNFQGRFYPIEKDSRFGNMLFNFEKDSFHLTLLHCTGKSFGRGTFEVKNKKLVLKFGDYPKPDDNIKITSKFAGDPDSVYLSLNVSTEEGNELYKLPGVSILVYGNKGTQTDLDGKASFVALKDSLDSKNITASFIGFTTEFITIDCKSGNYKEIEIKLKVGQIDYFPIGETIEFEILRSGFAGFRLRENENITTRFKKISKKRYSSILEY